MTPIRDEPGQSGVGRAYEAGTVLGVDGCPGGWIIAEVSGSATRWHRVREFSEVLRLPAEAIGVDMPIGLPERGRRGCDLAAKARLGPAHPRVFLAPPRAVLHAGTHAEASAAHRDLVDGKGLSIQTWHLFGKIREVDRVAEDPRLVEVHPELSFAALAGQVLASKHGSDGRAARVNALRVWLPDLDPALLPGGPVAKDALDALAAAWSALRWASGAAETLPAPDAPHDALGRPMRIVV